MDMDTELNHHNLLFGIRRSVRYHSRRQRFYEQLHARTTFINLLLGSATIAIFTNALPVAWPLWAKLAPAAIVTILSAADLVIGTMQKAWRHADLCRQFIELEKMLVNEDTDIAEVTRQRLAIEATEPPVLRVLDTLCHNELLRAMGYEKSQYIKVSWWQRLTANWTNFFEPAH